MRGFNVFDEDSWLDSFVRHESLSRAELLAALQVARDFLEVSLPGKVKISLPLLLQSYWMFGYA